MKNRRLLVQQQLIGELFGKMGIYIDFEGEMRGQGKVMAEHQPMLMGIQDNTNSAEYLQER